jgi:hypothetical protein
MWGVKFTITALGATPRSPNLASTATTRDAEGARRERAHTQHRTNRSRENEGDNACRGSKPQRIQVLHYRKWQ